MRKLMKKFFRGEEGAVTVDWVVLTAAVVGLAGVAFASIQAGSGGLGNSVSTWISGETPG